MKKKGYIYTMEVLIAVSLVFIAVVYILRYTPTKPELELSLMKMQGFEALDVLNGKGNLRILVNDGNETGLEAQLRSVIPTNLNFEAEICINSCSTTNVPENEVVVALDYYVSGYKTQYLGKKVRLWLWRRI